jgi:DeoR/GlpR family transcriptional regulator of sugar metabolism
MIPEERRDRVLDYVNRHGFVKISQLSELFGVSEMTIHRDLNNLEQRGQVKKTYGGVVSAQSRIEIGFNTRIRANIASKRAIGRAAASRVEDDDSILLDASTTALAMVPALEPRQGLTVFCTGVATLVALSRMPHIRVYGTGGELYHPSQGFFGMQPLEFLSRIHVDKYFAGVSGIHAVHGITDPLLQEVQIKRQSAAVAGRVIILADRTKFGRVTEFNTLSFDEIDLIITNAEGDAPCADGGNACVEEVARKGVEILFAEEAS